jgi:hypothetical protein
LDAISGPARGAALAIAERGVVPAVRWGRWGSCGSCAWHGALSPIEAWRLNFTATPSGWEVTLERMRQPGQPANSNNACAPKLEICAADCTAEGLPHARPPRLRGGDSTFPCENPGLSPLAACNPHCYDAGLVREQPRGGPSAGQGASVLGPIAWNRPGGARDSLGCSQSPFGMLEPTRVDAKWRGWIRNLANRTAELQD